MNRYNTPIFIVNKNTFVHVLAVYAYVIRNLGERNTIDFLI